MNHKCNSEVSLANENSLRVNMLIKNTIDQVFRHWPNCKSSVHSFWQRANKAEREHVTKLVRKHLGLIVQN